MSEAINEGLMAGVDSGQKTILMVSVADVGQSMQRFGWPDYVVFVCMLMLCVAIGLYFGFVRKATSSQEYLVGGRNMRTFPVSVSLFASFTSGISLLGIPTEIYVFGIQYMYIIGGILLMAVIAERVFIPVFHKLQITSTYEYLERRFDRRLRVFGSVLFTMNMLTWLPIVIYVPALAFNQVTGINVHIVTPVVCVICIFYTCVGGLKAVVWTDVIQTGFMLGAMVLVIIKGTIDIGGFHLVWERNWESDRIEGPNFDPDPLSRHTFWALVIGGSIYWLQGSVINQSMMQRYLSLPTVKSSQRALWFFILEILLMLTLCCYSGMLIFATYHKCDPLTTTLAREKDQLLPLLVMHVLGDFPGFPGLFVAGIFSAALSSLSTGLNSMAAVVLEDFYKPFFKKKLEEKQTYVFMKTTVVVLGVVFVGLVFIVEKMGSVLQLSMSVGAIGTGPALALFAMGLLLPWINAKGALLGAITGLISMSWLCFNAQAAIASGDLLFPEKPVSTEDCHYHFTPKKLSSVNFQLDPIFNTTDVQHTDERYMLYRLSYLWYTLVGATITTVTALLVSFITKPLDPRDVDPSLLAPFVRRLIPQREYPNQPTADDIIYAFGNTAKSVNAGEPNFGMNNMSVPESA